MVGQVGGLFAQPLLAAAGAAAIAIPIAIHLLSKRQRRPEPWGAMRFLVEAFRRHKQRLQLEQWLLLAVRSLIVLLLGLALAGPIVSGAASSAGLAGRGRLMVLVMDDSMSSWAAADDASNAAAGDLPAISETVRFEALRRRAMALVSSLEPSDRVSLWLAGRPVQPLVVHGTMDHAQVRSVIEGLTPRYGRSDVVAAMQQAAEELKAAPADVDQVFMVVLSDWSNDSIDFERAQPQRLSELLTDVQVIVNPPADEVANTQIADVSLQRSVVLVGPDDKVIVPIALTVKRFASDASQVASLTVTVNAGSAAEAIATAEDSVRFAPGEDSVEKQMSVAIDPVVLGRVLGAGWRASSGHMLTVEAQLPDDALKVDNLRWSILEVRPRLAVGLLVADSAAGSLQSDPGLKPHEWVRIALSPRSDEGEQTVEVLTAPASMAEQQAGRLGAAVVMRPDLLSEAGWQQMKHLATTGGVVWVMPPAEQAVAGWAQAMSEQLGLEWRIGMEPQLAADASDAVESADGPQTSEAAWQINVNEAEVRIPAPLELLSSDWWDLLRPVQVRKRLAIEKVGPNTEVWLSTKDNMPLMITEPIGDGHIVFLATAIDPEWTNLPTKPLFLPLVQETLRGLLGRSGDSASLASVQVGDQPSLGRSWASAQRLIDPNNAPLRLQRDDDGNQSPVDPLNLPGVYEGAPVANRLAVNVDPRAGDTRAISRERLGEWFGQVGTWRWFDAEAPATTMAGANQLASLGWPLLWVVLALVIFETCLARWFSHAKVEHAGSAWYQRVWRVFVRESA